MHFEHQLETRDIIQIGEALLAMIKKLDDRNVIELATNNAGLAFFPGSGTLVLATGYVNVGDGRLKEGDVVQHFGSRGIQVLGGEGGEELESLHFHDPVDDTDLKYETRYEQLMDDADWVQKTARDQRATLINSSQIRQAAEQIADEWETYDNELAA